MGRPTKRPTAIPDSKNSDTWYTCGEVAELLGCSRSGVKAREGRALHPVIDAHGTHRYPPAEVQALRFHDQRLGRGPALGPTTDGQLTAAAFQMIESGRSRNEVIIALGITAAQADALWEDYRIGSFEEAAAKHKVEQARKESEQRLREEEGARHRRREESAKRHSDTMATLLTPSKERR